MEDHQQKKLHVYYLKDFKGSKLSYPGDPKNGFMEPQQTFGVLFRFGDGIQPQKSSFGKVRSLGRNLMELI